MEGEAVLNEEHQKDKQRFAKMKETELEHGRGEKKATEVAAKEVKEMRKREGRSKESLDDDVE
jgi:hypothetical protein